VTMIMMCQLSGKSLSYGLGGRNSRNLMLTHLVWLKNTC